MTRRPSVGTAGDGDDRAGWSQHVVRARAGGRQPHRGGASRPGDGVPRSERGRHYDDTADASRLDAPAAGPQRSEASGRTSYTSRPSAVWPSEPTKALDPSTAALLWTIAFVVLGMNAFITTDLMGAIGFLARRTPALPAWLSTTALLNGGLWVLAGIGAASEAEVWGAVGFAAFLTWLAWTAAASTSLTRQSVA